MNFQSSTHIFPRFLISWSTICFLLLQFPIPLIMFTNFFDGIRFTPVVFDLKHHFFFFFFFFTISVFVRTFTASQQSRIEIPEVFFFPFHKYFQRCANVAGCWQQTVDAGYTGLTVNLNYDKIFQEAQTFSSDKSLTAVGVCVRLVGQWDYSTSTVKKTFSRRSISACPIKHQIKNRPGNPKCFLHSVWFYFIPRFFPETNGVFTAME